MRHTITLSAVLAAIWLFNSGHYTTMLLCLGVGSIVLVVMMAKLMGLIDSESQLTDLRIKLPVYWLWLVKEIILSNAEVVKLIWLNPQSISPCTARLPITQRTDMGRVIYANSITLTPGTVALEVEDDHVIVYALTRDGIATLESGEMDRRVTQLEK